LPEHGRQADSLAAFEPERASRMKPQSMAGEGNGRDYDVSALQIALHYRAADGAGFLQQ